MLGLNPETYHPKHRNLKPQSPKPETLRVGGRAGGFRDCLERVFSLRAILGVSVLAIPVGVEGFACYGFEWSGVGSDQDKVRSKGGITSGPRGGERGARRADALSAAPGVRILPRPSPSNHAHESAGGCYGFSGRHDPPSRMKKGQFFFARPPRCLDVHIVP